MPDLRCYPVSTSGVVRSCYIDEPGHYGTSLVEIRYDWLDGAPEEGALVLGGGIWR